MLNDLGVDAYRGATQLNVVEPELNDLQTFMSSYPHDAKYLIDHVIYLPVNKMVPFHELDRISIALKIVMEKASGKLLLPLKKHIKLQAKL